MYRGLGIALAMMCLFYAPASLFAQNTPADLNYPGDLLLKRTTLFQHDLGKAQTLTVIPAGLNSQTATIGYGQFLVPIDRPIYTLINNEELFYEHWHNLKSQQNKTKHPALKMLESSAVDREVFNALYNKPKVDEKKLLRLTWRKVFGFDVWYPYYKVKEIEDWVKERTSVRFLGFKGKAKFENDQILYVFKKTF